MYLSEFNYHSPGSLKEAIKIHSASENGAYLAGGTDLLVEMKKGIRSHTDLISLSKIRELKTVEEKDNSVFIGAGLTLTELMNEPLIRKNFPSLARAVSQIGSEQVRNSGTLGGNICTAASCCDTAPILMSLNASIEIAGPRKAKTLPLKDFFVHNKKTVLKKGEIVSGIIVPKQDSGSGTHFEKFGLREAGAISVVSAAAMLKVENGICTDACVVIGAVAATPKISEKASALLKGKTISYFKEGSELIENAGQAAADDSLPIDDIRGAANFRRKVLKTVTKRAILKALSSITN